MKVARGSSFPRRPKSDMFTSRASAQDLALGALAFLAQETDRIEGFFRMTGLDPGDVRALAGDSGFQLAVLDHLAGDEALLIDFAKWQGVPPETIGIARRLLGGGDE